MFFTWNKLNDMKKILLTAILLIGTLTIFAQSARRHDYNPTTRGEFNIMDYGAVSDDASADQAAIQAAIEAAYSQTQAYPNAGYLYGPTVYIPAGIYHITAPDTLRSYININIEPGAIFNFAAEYTGEMWVNDTTEALRHTSVTGGHYYQDGHKFTAIRLRSSQYSHPVNGVKFHDMFIVNADTALTMSTTSDGWVNACTFTDIKITNPVVGIITKAGTGTAGVDGHYFDRITLQCGDDTGAGISDLVGNYNMMHDLFLWDFIGYGVVNEITVSGDNNYLQGKFSQSRTTDTGDENYFHGGNWYQLPVETQFSTTGAITANVGITAAMIKNKQVIHYATAADIDITANPQIAAGKAGQVLTIVGGLNTLTLDDGTGIVLAGDAQCVLGYGDTITLFYWESQSRWVEISRSNN